MIPVFTSGDFSYKNTRRPTNRTVANTLEGWSCIRRTAALLVGEGVLELLPVVMPASDSSLSVELPVGVEEAEEDEVVEVSEALREPHWSLASLHFS